MLQEQSTVLSKEKPAYNSPGCLSPCIGVVPMHVHEQRWGVRVDF